MLADTEVKIAALEHFIGRRLALGTLCSLDAARIFHDRGRRRR
jgi:hypothetical protein